MEKPISMIIEETKIALSETINKCHLHPVIMELILKDIYLEICRFNSVNTAKEIEYYNQESTLTK